ncbi:hypothetical protein BCR33DRAFT_734737 [Rhizoclosmatium globosum]|uniref:Uncharacterized protein n=1 Tax=Rhizoclosmatium globosum TaxID=329046 RepID=A0A1Y2CSS5_9FUNG|nr:hypothetical protein BCR33DRAFT_734737 [Rhizoclosmatium globosum]|eukprot:ORY50007.1 hypothetical protein BCR33DRAFT_734737 [Rhizoclosmatium globosum]
MSYQPQNVQFDHYYGRGSKRLSESQNLYSHPTELIETHLLAPYQQPTLVSSMQQQHYFPSTPTSYVHGTQSVASKTRPSIPNLSHSWFPPNQSDILGPSYSQSQSTTKPNYTSIQMQPVLDPMTSAVAGSKTLLGQSQGMPVNSHQKIQRENVLGRWPSDKTLVSGDMTGGGLAMSQGQHNAAYHSNTLTNVGANYFKQHHPQTYQQQQQQLLLQHIAQTKLIHQHQQQHQNQHQQLPLDSEYSIGNSSSHSITNPYNYPSQATYQNMERNILEGQQWQQYDMNSKFNNSAQQHYLNLQHQVRHQLQTPSSQQYSLNAQQKSNTQLFHQHQTRSFSQPPNYSDVNLFQQSDILQQIQNQGQYDPTYSDILDGGCNDHILYSTSSHVPHRTSSLSYSNLYGSLDQQTLPKPLSHTLYSARDVQDAELQANETLSHSSALKLAQAPDLPPTLPEFSKFIHHMLVVILKKVPAGDASLKRLDTELSLYIENVLQTTEVVGFMIFEFDLNVLNLWR